jgi:UDP-glucose 4-epimerase
VIVRRELIPIVPALERLRLQAVHSRDVGDAYRRALLSDERGAFNIAAEPVLDPDELALVLGARKLRVPARLLRGAARAAYALRVTPTEPGWLDMALPVPLMDCTRARERLGWEPRHSSAEALLEVLDGLRCGADYPTPPLARATSGPGRLRELLRGVGARG